jgi:UDP-2,3-diacylglucosamine hydrolase
LAIGIYLAFGALGLGFSLVVGGLKKIGKSHYFISDAHLSNHDWRNTEILLKFLASLKNKAQSLFILGDLLELCFRYRKGIPQTNLKAFEGLRNLRKSGTKVYYILGNHDYWVRDYVKKEPSLFKLETLDGGEDGISVKTYRTLDLDGKKVYVAHGDEIDHSILTTLSRTVLRSQSNPLVYFLLHPKLGLVYARWFESIVRNLADSMGVVSKFESFARKKISEGYDIIILGHTHKSKVQKIEAGYYLNTGNWINNYSYVVIEDSQPRLETFIP